jgi:hypothetical protein
MAALRTLIFWLVALGVMAGLASFLPAEAHADALRRIERETRRDDDDDDDDDRGSRSRGGFLTINVHDSDDDDDDDDVSPEVAEAFVKLAIFPWSIPHAVLEESADPELTAQNRCLGTYARMPYRNGPGLLRNACDEPTYDEVRGILGFSSESGFMLQQVVPASLAVRVLLPKRLELAGRSDWWFDVAKGSSDRAWMNTADMAFRFAQSKHVQFRTGAGLRHFKLDETRWGFDLLYGMDVYGNRPIVFRMEVHAGMLGDAGFGQARATMGGMIGRVELYAGYDHTYLSDGRGAGAKIGGPIAGVRAWF